MTDLKCTKCGAEATYADAQIADQHQTCGAELTPGNTSESGRAIGGERHNWKEKGAKVVDTGESRFDIGPRAGRTL